MIYCEGSNSLGVGTFKTLIMLQSGILDFKMLSFLLKKPPFQPFVNVNVFKTPTRWPALNGCNQFDEMARGKGML